MTMTCVKMIPKLTIRTVFMTGWAVNQKILPLAVNFVAGLVCFLV